MKTKTWKADWVRLVVIAAVMMGAAGQVFGSIFADVVQPPYVSGTLEGYYNTWMLPAPPSIGTVGDGQQIAIPYGKSVVVALAGDYRAVDGTTYGPDIKVYCSGTSYAHMHIYVSSAEAPINESNRTWWAGGGGTWAGLTGIDLSDYPAFTAPVKYVRIWALGGPTDVVYLDAVEVLNYTPTNQAPVAGDIAVSTLGGSSIEIPWLTAASDPDGDALTVSATVGSETHGSVVVSDNVMTYTPVPGFAGEATFSYTVSDGSAQATGIVHVAVNALEVEIDIKPGSYPNSINLGSNGVVPVAILSTTAFDATTVDPASVSLSGAGVAVRGKANRYMASNQDVNGDGRLDLVLQVETENLSLSEEELLDGYGTVVGATYGGVPIIGTDEITIVPQ